MDAKEQFYQWWVENGKRGISFCECNRPEGVSLSQARKWVQEFKGVANPITKHKPKYRSKSKIVQLTDLHIPFQDNKSLNAVYDLLDNINPHQIVLTGDIFDFYELSKFDKNPDRKLTIQDEINEGFKVLKTLSSLCPEIHFVKGNHEDRLRRFLWQNPSLASLNVLELPNLLRLNELGIIYHDFEYIYNQFRYTHGSIIRSESGASAKAELMKYGSSMAHGHTHRLGMYLKTDARGTIGAYEMGCLCLTNPEYINGIPNWTQGLGVYFFEEDRFYCQQIPIINNKFIYGSRLYS